MSRIVPIHVHIQRHMHRHVKASMSFCSYSHMHKLMRVCVQRMCEFTYIHHTRNTIFTCKWIIQTYKGKPCAPPSRQALWPRRVYTATSSQTVAPTKEAHALSKSSTSVVEPTLKWKDTITARSESVSSFKYFPTIPWPWFKEFHTAPCWSLQGCMHGAIHWWKTWNVPPRTPNALVNDPFTWTPNEPPFGPSNPLSNASPRSSLRWP